MLFICTCDYKSYNFLNASPVSRGISQFKIELGPGVAVHAFSPRPQGQRQGHLCLKPGLRSRFQDSQNYIERRCQTKTVYAPTSFYPSNLYSLPRLRNPSQSYLRHSLLPHPFHVVFLIRNTSCPKGFFSLRKVTLLLGHQSCRVQI